MRLCFAAFAVPAVLLPAVCGAQLATRQAPTPGRGSVLPPAAVAVAAESAPVLDGRGSDAVWQAAPAITEFVQYFPRPDAPSAYRTEVRFAYDSRNLYVLARMFDPTPDSIVARLGRRDLDYPADWFGVTLDGYRDRRTGQEFRVSAGGGLFDALRLSDGQSGLTPSWNGAWDAKVSIDELGWTAELRIPFSQIRFSEKANPVFGLLMRRNVGRDDSEHAWPRVDAKRVFASWVSQGGDLSGLKDVGGASRLELTPYSATTNTSQLQGTRWSHPTTQSFGADVRYSITPNLSVNATLNPDFGQVEADPAQLNLSAYELFFAERRPFFLEGSSIFAFNSWCEDVFNAACTTNALYTRRIGRAPQLASRYGNAASPLTTRILGAAKLSGRVQGGTSLGLMAAATDREVGTGARTIEAQTKYLVGRAMREFRGGRGEYGGLLTYVQRDLDAWSEPFLRRDAAVGGVSARRRFAGDLQFDGALLASRVSGSRAAITSLQRDGVHRYQRLGRGLAVDTLATSLSGHSARAALMHIGGRFLWEASYQSLSPGFEMNDLGFMRRADLQTATVWAQHVQRDGRRWIRERNIGGAVRMSWNFAGLPIGRGDTPWPTFAHVYTMNRLRNTGQFNVFLRAVSFNHPADDYASRGGPALRGDPAFQLYSVYRGDSRRRVTPEAGISLWRWEQGRAWYRWFSFGLTFRPTTRLQGSFYIEAGEGREDLQWVGNRGVAGLDTTHYTVARQELRQVDPRVRLDWTMTPTLTLQWYAQPYVAGADYSNWRELDDPRAEAFDDRTRPFTGPNPPRAYTLHQLRSNTVLRWEFRPGSTLYAVWQQQRDLTISGRTLGSAAAAYDELFDAHPTNRFVLKLSYWFNP